MDLKGNEITIKTKSGQDLSISFDKFDSNAPMLAKLSIKRSGESKLAQALAKRKSMKVPAVTEDDLDKSHSLMNSEGNTVNANSLKRMMSVWSLQYNNPNRRIPLPWEN